MHYKKQYHDKICRYIVKKTEMNLLSMKVILKTKKQKNKFLKSKLLEEVFTYEKAKSKVQNMCVFTGRRRGVYRMFRVSRIQLRREVGSGGIYGLQKSS